MRAGFTGGLVVDFPNSTKAKKYYLCLFTGPSHEYQQMPALDQETEDRFKVGKRKASLMQMKKNRSKSKKKVKDRDWVLRKKELSRKRGKLDVPLDSKYTGRKRKDRF